MSSAELTSSSVMPWKEVWMERMIASGTVWPSVMLCIAKVELEDKLI